GAHYWGTGRALVQIIDRARARGVNIWADSYPYNTTGSDGSTALIPDWALEDEGYAVGSRAARDYAGTLRRVLDDADAAARLRTDIAHEIRRRGDPENITVFEHPNAAYVGKSLLEISRAEGLSPVEMAIKLQL